MSQRPTLHHPLTILALYCSLLGAAAGQPAKPAPAGENDAAKACSKEAAALKLNESDTRQYLEQCLRRQGSTTLKMLEQQGAPDSR